MKAMSINEKLRDDLHDQLFKAILELKSMEECYEFFEDICTIQEMKSIAARLEVESRRYLRRYCQKNGSQHGYYQSGQKVSQLRDGRI